MIKIYLIRHGRQNSALCNLDVPLSKEGRKQAYLAGVRLKEYEIDRLYSSNLIRAVETAQIIHEVLKIDAPKEIPYATYEDIKEIEFGELTGVDDDIIHEKYADFLAERVKCEEDLRYPGGENGEDVCKRAMPVIEEILKETVANGDKSVAIVTHGGVIRTLLAHIAGCDLMYKLRFARDLENCSITQIDYDEVNNRFYIERINDYAHIEKEDNLMRKHFKKSFIR